jgi:ketosteroid isomerase-like protein
MQAQESIKEKENMLEILLSLEKGAMERWRQGDPWGWTDISHKEILYVDPGLTKPIEGIDEYKKYLKPLAGTINYQISEFADPKVRRYGNLAILTYNYCDAKTKPDGTIFDPNLWNTTEVYVFEKGEWKIIHTHWSYIGHKLPTESEVPVLVENPAKEHEGLMEELLSLETRAMERWRKGDPFGFTDISADEVTYFDRDTPKRIDGSDALKKEYATRAGKTHFDVMEFIDPKIRISGDAAVLFYRFFSTDLNPDGSIARRTPWNCTEVYAKINDQWKIVHTHWSLINGEVKQ